MQPLRIPFKQACQLLSIGRDTLYSLVQKDPTFPKPYKYGNARQAPVYFDYADLVEWHNRQKANAVAEA